MNYSFKQRLTLNGAQIQNNFVGSSQAQLGENQVTFNGILSSDNKNSSNQYSSSRMKQKKAVDQNSRNTAMAQGGGGAKTQRSNSRKQNTVAFQSIPQMIHHSSSNSGNQSLHSSSQNRKNQMNNQNNNNNQTTNMGTPIGGLAQHSKTILLDAKQQKAIRQKHVNSALEKLHRDIIQYKDFYLKMRKEYDKIMIYENMFNRQRDQQKEFKILKKNMKKIVEKFFMHMFPQHQAKSLKWKESQKKKNMMKQKRVRINSRKKQGSGTTQIGGGSGEHVEEVHDLIYDVEFQEIIEERFEFFVEDPVVNLIQISYFQLLNFLEKIIETELNILEGTGLGGATPSDHTDILAYHGKNIQTRTMIKEQLRILKFLRLERFYLFIFWNFSKSLSAGLVPVVKERDFVYKRCIGSLKRLRQFIYSINYLVTTKRRKQMLQCYQNIRTFLMNTLQLMIDNLTSMNVGKSESSKQYNTEPKHMLLLKTLYGMADEMLSKNFLEDKKTNQKNLFDKDYTDTSRVNDGRSQNFEELMQSLKEQLDEIDFLDDQSNYDPENSPEQDQAIPASISTNQLQRRLQQLSPGSRQFQSHHLYNSSINNLRSPNLINIQDQQLKEDGEEFLKSLGFKDPFHKELLSTSPNHKNQKSTAGIQVLDQSEISYHRYQYPKQQFMTQDNLAKVDELLDKHPHFSTILANLLFSANNPFQEGQPFVHDTSFNKKYAKVQKKNFEKKGTIQFLFQDDLDDNSDTEDQPIDIYSVISYIDSMKALQNMNNNDIQGNQQGTFTNTFGAQHYRSNESVYSNNERFEKLVNSDFSFTKRFGHEKIEEKYAEIIAQQRQNRFKPQKNNDQMLFSNIDIEETKGDQTTRNGHEFQGDSSSSIRHFNFKKNQNGSTFFEQIEDNLNPYNRKKNQNSQLSGGRKTETGNSSNYWRRFSSSIEQSIVSGSRFQSITSMNGRRLSHSLKPREFGFGQRGGFATAGGGALLGSSAFDELSDHNDDMKIFNAINKGMNQNSIYKKRSATIHIRSNIKDKIQEEDYRQSDGRSKGQSKGIIRQQSSNNDSSGQSMTMKGKIPVANPKIRKPSSTKYQDFYW